MGKLLAITKLTESICIRTLPGFFIWVPSISFLHISDHCLSTAIKIVLSTSIISKVFLRHYRLSIIFKIMLLLIRFWEFCDRVVLDELLYLRVKNFTHLEYTFIDLSQVFFFTYFMDILHYFNQLLISSLTKEVHHWNSIAQMWCKRKHLIVDN